MLRRQSYKVKGNYFSICRFTTRSDCIILRPRRPPCLSRHMGNSKSCGTPVFVLEWNVPYIATKNGPVLSDRLWKVAKFKAALARDGAYLLRSNQGGWSAQEFWETYIQPTVVELLVKLWKSHNLLAHHRPGATAVEAMAVLWAKMLGALLQHWLLLTTSWPDDRRSLLNAARALRD
jgi:hypothetical protein